MDSHHLGKFTLTMAISDINIEGDVVEASNNGSMGKRRKATAEETETETSKKKKTAEEIAEEKIEIKIKRMLESLYNEVWTEDDESEGDEDEGEGEEVTVEDLAAEFYIAECLSKHENIPTLEARSQFCQDARIKYYKLIAEEKAKYVKMYKDREAEKIMKYKAYLRWSVGLSRTRPGGEDGRQG